jgi:hypothetical protein
MARLLSQTALRGNHKDSAEAKRHDKKSAAAQAIAYTHNLNAATCHQFLSAHKKV